MIPHGRDAVNGQAAAEILGKSYKTWRNRGLATELGLQPFNPGRKPLLYDRAQVEAARDGRQLPSWPVGTTKHPDDLLDEHDVAELLGIEESSVRHDRAVGRLPGWFDVQGVLHVRRAVLDVVIAARPGRGVGGGRPRGAKRSLGMETIEVPEGQALVLITVGDTARLVTALHPANAPLQVPATRIAEQAGLPANELPGRRFTVERLTQDDAEGFTLLDDPRK